MKSFLQEHKMNFIGFGILIICIATLAFTRETLAFILPDCESLTVLRCYITNDESVFGYSEKEFTPEIDKLILKDDKGNTFNKYKEDITILSYRNNKNIGFADIEVSIEDYQGSLWIQNAFSIYPTAVTGFKMSTADSGMVEVQWDEMKNVDGYLLYRSSDGVNFELLKEFAKDENLIYQDINIDTNAVYTYKVKAFKMVNGNSVCGFDSNTVQYNTPLATPVITAVKNVTFNSLKIEWNMVDGAVAYQVYHSLTPDGQFECIADIVSGTTTSFLDAKCESAVPNYYYVRACQRIGDREIWGLASTISSGMTTPNKVGISASGTDTEVSLSWKPSTGAQGYEVYCSTNGEGYVLVERIESAEQLFWSQDGFDKHTSYTFRIRPFCVVNGQTVYGSYSGTYEKEAVIVFDYSGEMGMDILRQYVGRPYVYGGQSPTKGWDCSYFVKWTFATHFGVELPRTAVQQSAYGITVSKNDRTQWQPGDLIFYRDNNGKGPVAHVVVYLGNGQMIHALSKKRGTLIQSVDEYETWDENKLYCVKRIFDN